MKKILFVFILLLAIALRFSFLVTVPPSASLDEATIGWNAYSILHTGKDEYGYTMPILLRAYDDYRPALYVYLVVPFVKILGLQVLSVRLPSVILSVLTVVMTYFLTKNLFINEKKKETIALVAMFLLAISPWHIYLSRLGHEVNLGLTSTVLSILLFLLGINRKNKWFLLSSFVAFGISFYSYQSEKVFTPLMLVSLCILFWKQLFAQKKYTISGLILFALISVPIFLASLTPGALYRLKGTSVFTENPRYTVSAQQILLARQKGDKIGELINNRRIVSAEIFMQNYFSHFNPWWLFSNTGDEPFKAPNTGLLYVWEFPFLLIGIAFLLFSKELSKKIKAVVILWVFIDFVAPGITTQAPHAMRAYTLLPVPQMLTSLGIIWTFVFLRKHSFGIAIGVIILTSVIAIEQFSQFVSNYFIVFPINQSESFQFAIQNAVQYIEDNKSKYQHVVISNKDNLYQSYMFYLFYTTYDPKKYLSQGGTKSGGFNETHRIDALEFRPINFQKETMRNTLFVGNPSDFPAGISPLFTSYYLDKKVGVTIIGESQ